MVRKDEYDIPLDNSGQNLLKVIKTFEKGLVDLVVVYYTIQRDERVPLVTYDTAHGFPHRDIRYLDEKDKRRKKEIDVNGLEGFLDAALEDISNNWRRYLREYKEVRR